MEKTADKIKNAGIIPVIAIKDKKDAVPLADALTRGGLSCAEITFRTDAARAAMAAISEERPDFMIGAGTVISTEQVDMALEAGASFIVMPGMDEKVVGYCLDRHILVIPGCATASDMQKACAMGLKLVKFFPAEQAGGIRYLEALSAPYGQLSFMPTGGINRNNLKNYLSWNRVAACGGSWIAPSNLIAEGKFDVIEENAREAVLEVLGFELRHIGINCSDSETAVNGSRRMEQIFGFPVNEGESNCFSDRYVEFLKRPYLGEDGHIAIGTRSIERALAYLRARKIDINEATKVLADNGSLKAVYLREEICGFAIHLLQV